MFERLSQLEARYEELTRALASPEVINDSAKYQKTAKAHSELTDIVEKYREYKDLTHGIAESKAVLAEEKDPDMRAYAQEEITHLEVRVRRVEEELKVLLLPKDPNDEKDVILGIRGGRTERSDRHHRRQARLLAAEVRERRAPRAARACDRAAGPRAYLGGHGRGAARGGRRRHQDRSQRPAHRHLLLLRPGRPVGEHDVLGRAHHAHPNQHRGQLPGRKVADQEPRESHAGAALAPLRSRDAETAGSTGQRAQGDGGDRRPQRKDPHLQLPAEPRHRPPHRPDHPPAERGHGREAPTDRRCAGHALPGRKAEGRGRRAGGVMRSGRSRLPSSVERRAYSVHPCRVVNKAEGRLW